MVFFSNKKDKQAKHAKESNAELIKTKNELFGVIDDATNKTERVTRQIEKIKREGGTVGLLFLAMGGDKRL